jgi:hypothetical protein
MFFGYLEHFSKGKVSMKNNNLNAAVSRVRCGCRIHALEDIILKAGVFMFFP